MFAFVFVQSEQAFVQCEQAFVQCEQAFPAFSRLCERWKRNISLLDASLNVMLLH